MVLQPDTDPVNYFHYARMLAANKKYDEAKVWYNKYLSVKPDDKTAQVLLASCDSTVMFNRDTLRYQIDEVQLKGLENYYTTALYKDGFIFAADRSEIDADKVNPWTGNSYLDLYYTENKGTNKWTEPALIGGQVNGPFHEGPSVVSKDGKTIYFTRSNYSKTKLRKSKDNTNNLKLFKATLDGDKWKDLMEFKYNSDEYSMGHPTLSADEQTLYFISDMPGGLGGTDIYMAKKEGEGWGNPINLGPGINTSLNEMFPFYCPGDSTLYFSSQGHTNMGGLDVFSAKDLGSGKFDRAVNEGYPLNTTQDDFAFTMKGDMKNGYISSNRLGGDKIFTFVKKKVVPQMAFMLVGTVIDKSTGLPLPNSKVEVIDMQNNTKLEFTTDANGNYQTPIAVNTDYSLIATKDKYSTATDDATTKGLTKSETLRKDFILDPYKPKLSVDFALENIYYDLDKYNIRPDAAVELDKIVKLMNEYPSMVIELGSHTDSRANDQYNITLSDNRAKSAVAYLVKRGIAKDRLTWKGYGETKLVNGCVNDATCTEEEHQRNRRTTFKVLSY
ncbi:MAG: OmpA family protein [Sphingobacteriales bacterium JAD_PAG50586_3]|nr:MAG: OmpA family protein [Sphingobacteriales bacterium JAD_PAG50586_3]